MKRIISLITIFVSMVTYAQNPSIVLNDSFTILAGEELSLDASQSTDPDGTTLNFSWSVIKAPEGSKRSIRNISNPLASLVVDRVGSYVLALLVTDADGEVSEKLIDITSVSAIGDIVYGPIAYNIVQDCLLKSEFDKSSCSDYQRTFLIAEPGSNYSLLVKNNGIHTALLSLNGEATTSFYDFSGDYSTYAKNIALQASNTLDLKLGGKVDENIEITIRKNEQPVDSNIRPNLFSDTIVYYGDDGVDHQVAMTDADNNLLTLMIVESPVFGTAEIVSGNHIKYVPNASYTGDDHVVVGVLDDGTPQKLKTKRIPIRFSTDNRPPILSVEQIASHGEAVPGKILINDNYGQTHSYLLVSAALNGTVSQITNDGNYVYTPNSNFVGEDRFTVRVTDSGIPSLSSELEVIVNVEANTAPTLYDIETVNTEQGVTQFRFFGFEEVDLYQELSFNISRQPSSGSVFLTDGTFTYTPNPDFSGVDTFDITVSDNAVSPMSSTKTVSIIVDENDIPVVTVSAPSFETSPGGTIQISYRFTDDNINQTHDISIANNLIGGTVNISNTLISYTANDSFIGTERIALEVKDNGSPSKSGTIIFDIVVKGNEPPAPTYKLSNDFLSFNEHTFVDITHNDPDSTLHTYEVISGPVNGTLEPTWFPTRHKYTPNEGFSGVDSFVVRVVDNGFPPMNGEVVVTINVDENSAPAPINRSFDVASGMDFTNIVSCNDPDVFQKCTYVISGSPANGTASLNGSVLSYKSNDGYSGQDSVDIVTTDNGSPSLSTTFTYTFNVKVNTAPVLLPQTYITAKNKSIRMYLRASDVDFGQQSISYSVARDASNGTVQNSNGSESFLYTPTPGFVGTDSFDITATDNGIPNLSSTATITINVQENSAPVIMATNLRVLQGTSGQVLVSTSDPNNDVLSLSLLAPPVGGSARSRVINSNFSRIFYTPADDFFGSDNIILRVKEAVTVKGLFSDAGINITVVENLAPEPIADLDIQVLEGNKVQFKVFSNDPNEIEFPTNFTFEIIKKPQFGQIAVSPASNNRREETYEYEPTLGFSGTDFVTIKVTDSSRVPLSAEIVVPIEVIANSVPISSIADLNVISGGSVEGTISVLDPDLGQNHSFELVTQAGSGVANVDADGKVSYSSNIGSTDLDTFVIRVFDDAIIPKSFDLNVVVNIFQNTIPTLTIAPIVVAESGSATQIFSIQDPDQGQVQVVSIVGQPTKGQANIWQNTLTYINDSNQAGIDTVRLKVSDDANPPGESFVDVQITIIANQPPIIAANPSSVTTFQSTPTAVTLSYSDPDVGQNVSVIVDSISSNILSANINQSGVMTIIPKDGATGNGNVLVSVQDNATVPLKTTLNIPVQIIANTPPGISISDFSTFQSTSKTISFTVSDPNDGQEVTVSKKSVVNGDISINNISKTLTYTPNVGFSGQDSFVLNVADNAVPPAVIEKTVTVTVDANTAPVVSPGTIAFNYLDDSKDTQVTFTDPDVGQTHTYSIQQQSPLGHATIDQSGLLTFTPNNTLVGSSTLTVGVADNASPSAIGTADFTVTVVNNLAEILGPDSGEIRAGLILDLTYSLSDLDINQEHQLNIQSMPTNGTLNVDVITNVVTYIPFVEFSGVDTFTLVVSDNGPGGVDITKVVSINVLPSNKAPVLSGSDISTLTGEDGTTIVSVHDPDIGQSHSFDIFMEPANGTVVIDNLGNIIYRSNNTFSGSDMFQVRVTDNGEPQKSDILTLYAHVQANSAPLPNNITIADAVEGMDLNFTIYPNDLDLHHTHSFTIMDVPVAGTAIIDGQGIVTYTAEVGYIGDVSFTVLVTDNGHPMMSNTSIVNLTFLANEAPSISISDISTLKNTSKTEAATVTDPNGSRQTVSLNILTDPVNGTVSIDNEMNITYTPNFDYIGVDSFTLEASDNGNPQLSTTKVVNVNIIDGSNTPPTYADFYYEYTTGNAPFRTFVFLDGIFDADGTVSQIELDFGDGSNNLIIQNPDSDVEFLHYYFTAGSYTVTATITDDLGTETTVSQMISVLDTSLPVTKPTIAKNNYTVGETITLDGSLSYDTDGIVSYHAWFIESTNVDEYIEQVTTDYTFTSSGVYKICHLVSDENTAIGESCYQVFVDTPSDTNNFKPTINVSTSVSYGLAPLSVNFDASDTFVLGGTLDRVVWLFNENSVLDSTTGISPSFTFEEDGIHRVKVIAYDTAGNSSEKFVEIFVGDVNTPAAMHYEAISVDGISISLNAVISGFVKEDGMTWDLGDGNSSVGTNVQHTYSNPGVYQVNVNSYDFLNRPVTSSRSISMSTSGPSPVVGLSATEFSPGTDIIFNFASSTGSGPLNYKVDLGDGNIIDVLSTSTDLIHQYTEAGIYELKFYVYDQNGLVGISDQQLTINGANPPAAVISPLVSTGNTPYLLDVNALSSTDNVIISDYLWVLTGPAGILIADEDSSLNINLTKVGTYTLDLYVWDDEGNSSKNSTSFDVTEDQTPSPIQINELYINHETSYLPIEAYTILDYTSPAELDEVTWDFGDGSLPVTVRAADLGPDEYLDEYTHIYQAIGDYTITVTVKDINGLTETYSQAHSVVETEAPLAVISADILSGPGPLTVNLDGLGSTDTDGTVVDYFWQIDAIDFEAEGPSTTVTFNDPGIYTVDLFVVDDNYAVGFSSVDISVSSGAVKILRSNMNKSNVKIRNILRSLISRGNK